MTQRSNSNRAKMRGQSMGIAAMAATCCIAADSSDMTSCEQVGQFFEKVRKLIDPKTQCIVIDLQQVDRADTKLLACLVALYQLAARSSVRLEVFESVAVHRVVDFCRLGWLMERTTPRSASPASA